MKIRSEIKHSVLLIFAIIVIGMLALTLEGSELNSIKRIEINGNKYLSIEQYLNYSQLNNIVSDDQLTAAIIRDRLSKHPYIRNIDVVREERGIVKVYIFERKMDAVLLQESNKYLICDSGEILPFIPSTSNINLPVIINNLRDYKADAFTDVRVLKRIFQALKIISTAEIYDKNLYNDISEINLNKDNISLQLIDLTLPIYFGVENEIAKTVYLSKIFKRINRNKFTEYLDYIDLRFDDLVYLGFDENFINDKESI